MAEEKKKAKRILITMTDRDYDEFEKLAKKNKKNISWSIRFCMRRTLELGGDLIATPEQLKY